MILKWIRALGNKCLQATCLKPRYSLRRQLIVGYGIVAWIAIGCVIILATWATLECKSIVQDSSQYYLVETSTLEHMMDHSILVSGALERRILYNWRGTAALLSEFIADRHSYYYNHFQPQEEKGDGSVVNNNNTSATVTATATEGVGDDMYPLRADPNLLWRIHGENGEVYRNNDATKFVSNWNTLDAIQEHAFLSIPTSLSSLSEKTTSSFSSDDDNNNEQEGGGGGRRHPHIDNLLDRRRRVFLPHIGRWSTESAMCWNCDDIFDDDDDASYNAGKQIAADIGMLLKPIWESEPAAYQVRVGFYNNTGTLIFPSFDNNDNFGNDDDKTYISQGCQWIVNKINQYTNRTFGTAKDLKRCNPSGFKVNINEYNMLEQTFCHDQILHPEETRLWGPYLDPITQHWIMTIGQAVFDGYGNFLACTAINMSMDILLQGLLVNTANIREGRSQVAIVKSDGTLLEISTESQTKLPPLYKGNTHIVDTGFIDEQAWNILVNKTFTYETREEWMNNTYYDEEHNRVYAAVPSPLPPLSIMNGTTDVGAGNQIPQFFVLEAANGTEVFSTVLDKIDEATNEDMQSLLIHIFALGISGLIVFMFIVWLVSRRLTRPVKYMESVSWKIVNHAQTSIIAQSSTRNSNISDNNSRSFSNSLPGSAGSSKATAKNSDLEGALALGDALDNTFLDHGEDNKDAIQHNKSPLLPCTPNTEVSDLVNEFDVMIHGFSGTGASKVASSPKDGAEVLNCVTYKKEYGRYYELSTELKMQIKQEHRRQRQSSYDSYDGNREMSKTFDAVMKSIDSHSVLPTSALAGASSATSSIGADDEDSRGDDSEQQQLEEPYQSSDSIAAAAAALSLGAPGEEKKETDPNQSRRRSLIRSSFLNRMPTGEEDKNDDDEDESAPSGHRSQHEEDHSSMFQSAWMGTSSASLKESISTEFSLEASASAYFRNKVDTSALLRAGAVTRANLGPNSSQDNTRKSTDDIEDNLEKISRSRLFRFILCCIALPLILTVAVISTVVAEELLNSFPTLFQLGERLSVDLGEESIDNLATLLALHTEEVQRASLRDLFVLTRSAGWVLFGAVNRSDNILADTEILMVEECKTYSLEQQCPYQLDDSRSPCDCEWKDPWKRQCKSFQPAGSRHLQRPFYLNQARDFDPISGYRNESLSFHLGYDHSPETTLWFDKPADLPGSYKGSDASGYATTYDRFRVMASLAAINIPLYNYVVRDKFIETHPSTGSYVAYESDGGYWGYSGCEEAPSRYAHWESTLENSASDIRPELCPLTKFGYDPRCRSWYANTKQSSLEFGEGLYVSSPFVFAILDDSVGMTAGSPLIDPQTGEFVGVAALDVPLVPLDRVIELPQTDSQFYFVISPDTFSENDAILGPNYPFGSPPMRIANVILPNDDEISDNRENFEKITTHMKQGASGDGYFYRTLDDGCERKYYISYSPINARVLTPISPDDYSRGANVSNLLLFSIAVARSVEEIEAPFKEVEASIEEEITPIVTYFLIGNAIITFFCILCAAKISVAVTKPMIVLLQIVQRVNAGRIDDDLPPLEGGSREVNQVYTSFAKLYKIVRMSNSSFFSGDFEWANHIAGDALKLFRKVKDEKAIAIACNNVGNTLLALSIQGRVKGSCELVDSVCCVRSALEHYNEAIEIGQRQFDSGDSDAMKAEFAQQLADRHFNRAICLLYSLDDPCVPENACEVAYADLLRCRDYDKGVREFFMHSKLMFKYSDICFERNIRRLYGLASLGAIDNFVWQIWDAFDLVDETDLILQAAWNAENAPLFTSMTRVGRLQQLEGAVIGLEMSSGNFEEAAKLAMRMLIEDEYILETSFTFAADAVLHVLTESTEASLQKAAVTGTRYEFQRMRKLGKMATLGVGGKCFIFCIEISSNFLDAAVRSLLAQECLAFYDEQCSDKDEFGLIGLTTSVDSNFVVQLGPKKLDALEQTAGIEKAIHNKAKSASYPALPSAVNLIVETAKSNAQDAVLVYITDGSVWDSQSFTVMESKINESNARRSSNIDIISIGVGVDTNSEFAGHCNKLCRSVRSRQSGCYFCSVDEIEETFDCVRKLMAPTSSATRSRVLLGTTMEKF